MPPPSFLLDMLVIPYFTWHLIIRLVFDQCLDQAQSKPVPGIPSAVSGPILQHADRPSED